MKAKENIDQRATIKIIRTKIQNQKQICTIKKQLLSSNIYFNFRKLQSKQGSFKENIEE